MHTSAPLHLFSLAQPRSSTVNTEQRVNLGMQACEGWAAHDAATTAAGPVRAAGSPAC